MTASGENSVAALEALAWCARRQAGRREAAEATVELVKADRRR